jgi:hypothetical protein
LEKLDLVADAYLWKITSEAYDRTKFLGDFISKDNGVQCFLENRPDPESHTDMLGKYWDKSKDDKVRSCDWELIEQDLYYAETEWGQKCFRFDSSSGKYFLHTYGVADWSKDKHTL